MFAFTPWPHFAATTANATALAAFVERVKYRPRGGQGSSFLPPVVHGLASVVRGGNGALSWSPDVFADAPGFTWSQWSDFLRFEVWRGARPDFTTADGQPVTTATAPSLASIRLDWSRPYYKVRAVARNGGRGPLSDAVGVGAPRSGVGGPGVRVGPIPTGVWQRR